MSPFLEHIVKSGSGYRLLSKKTGKNFGSASSLSAIKKRERQVQYFKHQNETATSMDAGSYNDGDEGLNGSLYRRPNTTLLNNSEQMSSDPGIYSYFEIRTESAHAIYEWACRMGIPNPVLPNELHSSVVASPTYFEGYTVFEGIFALNPDSYSLGILGEALVLKFESYPHRLQWQKAKNLGAFFLYDEMQPHITITYNPEGFDLANLIVPRIPIMLTKELMHGFHKEQIEKASVNEAFEDLISNARDVASNWVDTGKGRAQMTRLAKLTVGGALKDFHPGKDVVFRGQHPENGVSHQDVGTSWSKAKTIAVKYATGKDALGKVFKKKICPKVPALDINKLLQKTLKDKEVFIAK